MSDKTPSLSSEKFARSTEMLAMMHPWSHIRLQAPQQQQQQQSTTTPPQVISFYPAAMTAATVLAAQRELNLQATSPCNPAFVRKRSLEDSPTPPPPQQQPPVAGSGSSTALQQQQQQGGRTPPAGCSSIPSKRPERMKDWLIRQIDSREHPGLEWVRKEAGMFCIPWRHAKHRDYDPNTDASIFRAWAVQSKRYHGEGDQASWKANFRSAICSLPDVKELPEKRTDRYRVFQIVLEQSSPKRPRLSVNSPLCEVVPLLPSPPPVNGLAVSAHIPTGMKHLPPLVCLSSRQPYSLTHSLVGVRSTWPDQPASNMADARSPLADRSSPGSLLPIQVSCIRGSLKSGSISSSSSASTTSLHQTTAAVNNGEECDPRATPTSHASSRHSSVAPCLSPISYSDHTHYEHVTMETNDGMDQQHKGKATPEVFEDNFESDIDDDNCHDDDCLDSGCHGDDRHDDDGDDDDEKCNPSSSDQLVMDAPTGDSDDDDHKPPDMMVTKVDTSTDEVRHVACISKLPRLLKSPPTHFNPVKTSPSPPTHPVVVKSCHAHQFHVAVYYNNLNPVVLETVKNKHGCYIYSGLESDCSPPPHSGSAHCLHLPVENHTSSSQHPSSSASSFVLSLLAKGLLVESSEDGSLFVTSHSPLVVYSRSVSSPRGSEVQRLGLGQREKVFDYQAFKDALYSAMEKNRSPTHEVPSPYVILTLGQPMHKEHPLMVNYITVVIYLRRAIRRLETTSNTHLPPTNSFDCISLTTPPLELHGSECGKLQLLASHK